MNLRKFFLLYFLFFLLVLFLFLPNNKAIVSSVVTYPAPSETTSAIDFVVQANNKDVFVYDLLEEANFNHSRSIKAPLAYFSFSGNANVTVSTNETVETVDIRPKQLGIKPLIKGKEISFNLTEPCNLSIEINGNLKRPLLLFANPLETDIPDPNDPNVIYFEGGKIHDVGEINNDNTSGKTVYIAGGAVVKGQVVANNADNFKLLGRGILQTKDSGNTIWMRQVQNVEVNGPILINKMDEWTYHLVKSSQVSINNLKVLATKRDGIDITSSQDITVDKCFIMSVDDPIAIKAMKKYGDGEEVHNVNILNSGIWNVSGGQGLAIGGKSGTPLMSNILFKNIDIIHSVSNSFFHPLVIEAVMTIVPAYQAMVRDVKYENIRIEDAREDYLIYLGLKNYLSGNIEPGNIRDIYFKNIQVIDNSAFLPSAFNGFDRNHKIVNVQFEGLWNNGKRIRSMRQAKFQKNRYVENILLR